MKAASDPFVVEIDHLAHVYDGVSALRDVRLRIPAGSMTGLIGPDSSGKSTLLGLIAGTRRLQQGEVRVLGGDIADATHRRHCYARIAFMPQGLGRNLYPSLSVAENLHFFGKLHGQSRGERAGRIENLLSATGLLDFSARPAGKLSGGMKQKLGLCAALMHEPDLLILDEPTTGIDPLSRRNFWTLIEQVRQGHPGMSVIVATAYMEEAERFDWLAAMFRGRVTATGTARHLKESTQAETLEKAFIHLMPAEHRAGYEPVVLPARGESGGAPVIAANNLTCRFGNFTAVDAVSFEIGRGEIFGFLGSNGCGKTTTMKMLTGLLQPTEGSATVLGQPVNVTDLSTRLHVGYMSQSFSLYTELTVRQNLNLHARLFHIPEQHIGPRSDALLRRFGLDGVADRLPPELPLGLRQRLSLAVALIHGPSLLILDEPTSGVDPVARDDFWRLLINLSRVDGVTIFISTHFMNEAERCDRVSLMHAGRVLAVGSPAELARRKNCPTLEECFVAYLKEADASLAGGTRSLAARQSAVPPVVAFSARRLAAFASREATELLRDPIRLAFAVLGPLILLVTFGFGITFDVERLSFAVLDNDQSFESRELIESLRGSRYFVEQPPAVDVADLERRLNGGGLSMALEIPSGFGRDLWRGARPELAVWLDGAMPFRAETARGYLEGLVLQFADDLGRRRGAAGSALPASIEIRLPFNQRFESVYSIVPGVIMLLLAMIPSMMTALGIVREKEIGSIINFHATPVSNVEFLIGKQIPYVAVALCNFLSLWALATFLFGIETSGSATALMLGALCYVAASTAFGLLVSSFVKTQIAAVFATAIVIMIPTVNFSGFMTPIASLDQAGRAFGLAFPGAYFQQISIGTFTKGLQWGDLWINHLALLVFAVGYLTAATCLLRKQER